MCIFLLVVSYIFSLDFKRKWNFSFNWRISLNCFVQWKIQWQPLRKVVCVYVLLLDRQTKSTGNVSMKPDCPEKEIFQVICSTINWETLWEETCIKKRPGNLKESNTGFVINTTKFIHKSFKKRGKAFLQIEVCWR